jgi:predicted RNA-binding protein associated with RNAse of E/G family
MKDMQSRFCHGESILYRELDEHGRIVDAKPVVVVEDFDTRVVLWLPLGTPTKKPVLLNHTPGTPRRWEEGNWELVDGVWRWAEILIIVRPDDFRATWVRWSADRIFQGWYVNLQSKLTRTHLGFDLTDHQLDIVVEPNRNWRWKDQDELDLHVELGRLTPKQAKTIRAEGQRAIEEIEGNGGSFSDGWEEWCPDPLLTRPELTANWNDLSMYH